MPVPFEITPTGTILVHEPEETMEGIVTLYARVSSFDQKAALERQVIRLLKFANVLEHREQLTRFGFEYIEAALRAGDAAFWWPKKKK